MFVARMKSPPGVFWHVFVAAAVAGRSRGRRSGGGGGEDGDCGGESASEPHAAQSLAEGRG